MSRQKTLLSAVQLVQDEIEAFAAGLSAGEREAKGTAEQWAAKDMLAHMVAWQERLALRMRGESNNLVTEVDAENAAIYAAHQDQTLTDALAWSRSTHASLMAALGALSEQDLAVVDRPWTDGYPVWRQIASTACLHPYAHVGEYYSRHGQPNRAIAIYETAVASLKDLDSDPQWQGLLTYNLACLYALGGKKELALSNLVEALRLNPDLTEWSKQDPDFISLRTDRDYLALYD